MLEQFPWGLLSVKSRDLLNSILSVMCQRNKTLNLILSWRWRISKLIAEEIVCATYNDIIIKTINGEKCRVRALIKYCLINQYGRCWYFIFLCDFLQHYWIIIYNAFQIVAVEIATSLYLSRYYMFEIKFIWTKLSWLINF